MLKEIIEGNDLDFKGSYSLFCNLLEESDLKVAAYLVALQSKGYTSEEIAGLAQAMRDKALKIGLGKVADTCGTGGDGSCTINVSTAAAIILSCFRRVAKHGNVSITSNSGSANVLEALGVGIENLPQDAQKYMEGSNFTFLLAPLYHPALKKIMPVRKQLGVKTVFNILGPLANPASPQFQLVGVNSPDLVEKVAHALHIMGVEKALVVHGSGMDEVNPCARTTIAEVNDRVELYSVEPGDFGLKESKIVKCSSCEESAQRIMSVFSGKTGNDADFVLMNASAALYASNVAGDLMEGVEIVRNAIEEGKIVAKVEEIQNAGKIRIC
ncbi:MAG: anthranilate phosphoribosyltransferase [Archaeoglobaceae archaeon]